MSSILYSSKSGDIKVETTSIADKNIAHNVILQQEDEQTANVPCKDFLMFIIHWVL